MIRGPRAGTVALIAIILLGISACGQMGPLSLPDDVVNDSDEDSDEENER